MNIVLPTGEEMVLKKLPVSGISEQGRATQGVKLIRLDEGDEIAAITQLDDQGQNGNSENGNTVPEATDNTENTSTESPE
jgi:DNA gyrase subunit A